MNSNRQSESLLNDIVVPIVISTPFAVGKVFCYLIKDEKTVLIDCGHKSDDSWKQLKSVLNEHGLMIKDIDEIWLTHGHPDHYGQAALLADESDAKIKGHRKERTNFAGNDDGDLFEAFFKKHRIPKKKIELMVNQLDWLQQYQDPITPDWIDEEETLDSGQLKFKVKHTPGHAPGHVTFYTADGLFFAGDVLLEHISTNALINFDPETRQRNKSLLQYRRSLEWIKQNEGRVMPGHGKQIENIRKVAEHHLQEQNNRYKEIMKLLQEKPRSLMDLSRLLFPDALQTGAHFLVFSEVIGYLDWGIEEGIIDEEEGIFRSVN